MLSREAERVFHSFLQFARSLRSSFVHLFPSVCLLSGPLKPRVCDSEPLARGGERGGRHGVGRLPPGLLVQLPGDLFTPQPDPLERGLVRLELSVRAEIQTWKQRSVRSSRFPGRPQFPRVWIPYSRWVRFGVFVSSDLRLPISAVGSFGEFSR